MGGTTQVAITCAHVEALPAADIDWAFSLTEACMESLYASSQQGWNAEEKKADMQSPRMHYLIARRKVSLAPCMRGGDPVQHTCTGPGCAVPVPVPVPVLWLLHVGALREVALLHCVRLTRGDRARRGACFVPQGTPTPLGFACGLFDMEDDHAVFYLYELMVDTAARRTG